MSKQLKDLIAGDVRKRLAGVNDALLVDVIGLNSQNTFALRKALRAKNLQLLVVKNSLARRATEGTPLSQAFDQSEGSLALVWGGEDFVSLAKELVEIHRKPEFEKLASKGGVMEGEKLSADKVKEISKWPNRAGQISIVLGQILSPGSKLLSQITGPGGKLLSQIKKKSEGEEAPPPAA